MSDKALVIIGTGPSIAQSVACLFAAKRYSRVVKGVVVRAYAVDIADHNALADAMDMVRRDLGQPECIFYNAARIFCTSLAAITHSELPGLLNIASSGPSARPAKAVTSSMLPQKPEPPLFSLFSVRAAQRNQVLALHETFHSKGVHVGAVNSKDKPSFEVQIL
ncbi:hypothetical protein F5883DRAFT_600571 [Diaporthe sp. PMI_573]|nr:hypothetical protein F5883DRAFT_600571 [Diaporthaceae sp. PMI_573]